MTEPNRSLKPIEWVGGVDGRLRLLDQTTLPTEVRHIDCLDPAAAWEAIRSLRVRGAPAIGIAAAYAVCLSPQEGMTTRQLLEAANSAIDFLATSRPTAVNLFWALDRMREVLVGADVSCSPMDLRQAILNAARQIHEQDIQVCRTIGRVGADLVPEPACILTHCNTGSLATSEYGTALSVIFTAQDQGKRIQVYVCETRPLLQGARLTAWELQCRGIPNTLICDSAAGMVMKSRGVQLVLTGADRIVANGDAANKIGTYGLAVLARAHNIPFYIVAPRTSFDLATLSGEQIPIEERASEEITHGFGKQTAPEGIDVFNPAFDVTPAHLITGIITEAGVIQPVSREIIAAAFLPQAPSTPPPGWLAAPQR